MLRSDKTSSFFLDTASISEIVEAISWNVFNGLTTNPILFKNEGKPFWEHLKDIVEVVPDDWDLSIPVHGTSYQEITNFALKLLNYNEKIRIKIPGTIDGLLALKDLPLEAKINITIIKSPSQALILKAAAENLRIKDFYVSVFCNRLNDIGVDWTNVIKCLSDKIFPGKIIAASIKSSQQISDSFINGADIVTAPLSVYKMAMTSKLVAEDEANFHSAWGTQLD